MIISITEYLLVKKKKMSLNFRLFAATLPKIKRRFTSLTVTNFIILRLLALLWQKLYDSSVLNETICKDLKFTLNYFCPVNFNDFELNFPNSEFKEYHLFVAGPIYCKIPRITKYLIRSFLYFIALLITSIRGGNRIKSFMFRNFWSLECCFQIASFTCNF